MKISKINNSNYIYHNRKNDKQAFEGSRNYIHIGRTYLNKIDGEVTPQTVEGLSMQTKIMLRLFTPKRIKELAQMNCYAADKLKKNLDGLFGKDNYTMIAIGRSVASIAETMKYMGSDVKIIPLSGLSFGIPKKIPDKNVYKDYLDLIGINSETINRNKERKYILLDFTCTGDSLKNAEYFIKNEILESNPVNLISMSVNQALGNDYDSKFALLFSLCRFKEFSPVGKLSLYNLKRSYEQAYFKSSTESQSNMANYLRNLFLFNVFDILKKGNFDNSCQKEIKVLTKHYFSPKVLIKLFLEKYKDDCV